MLIAKITNQFEKTIKPNVISNSPNAVKFTGSDKVNISTDISSNGRVIEVLRNIANEIKDAKIEKGFIVDDKTGDILYKASGNADSVDLNNPSARNNIQIHNHPGISTGNASWLFSASDIMCAIMDKVKETRVVTPK
ncbi:MAG: hypothetical protein ACD_20C00197G0019 [uncultured bacterium]|nr:MAG: hypothetical protein ACD_20C00197G0019 [uncultured bacterium]HBH18661.1 hypothetical protein [Cyanobacteria bacterium UBA9579]